MEERGKIYYTIKDILTQVFSTNLTCIYINVSILYNIHVHASDRLLSSLKHTTRKGGARLDKR